MQSTPSTQSESTLAQRMKRYRLRRKWSLKKMGQMVGLSTNGVWQIETGKVEPHEVTVQKIREALPQLFDDKEGAA